MPRLDTVRAYVATVADAGQPLAAQQLARRFHISKTQAAALLQTVQAAPVAEAGTDAAHPPDQPVAAPDAPPAPVPVAVEAPAPAPPVTLLQQAEAALQAAQLTERQAHRAYDFASQQERDQLQQAWIGARKVREQAAELVAQRQRARESLITQIPAARIAARRAQGEWAAVQETARRSLMQAKRQADMAQEDVQRLVADLVAITGPEAVPHEPAP
jgi:hypothetical protein